MFKSARWKKGKTKIKAVFKLQFQATQVPQLKGKGVMISLVPADVGKPTVRLRKAPIVEGTCSWENPIYETVKLTRETKTGTFKEKVYYFDVSTGSSKASYLGEASVDFADFAEATNAFKISLPLDASNSGPILHVTIEKMQGTDDLRDGEETEARRAESLDGSLRNEMGDNGYENTNLNITEDEYFNRETSQEADTTIHQDFTNHRRNSMPQTRTVDVIPAEKLLHSRSNTDWSLGSASEGSMMDSTNSPGESFPRDVPEVSDNPIDLLRKEISKLERQAEISDMELQSLRKQIAKESRRGQDLSLKVVSLKEENEALNAECEQLKSAPNESDLEIENLSALLEEKSKEHKNEKDLNKRLRLQLHRTEDSNSELVLALTDLNKMLEQKSTEISHLSRKRKDSEEATEQLFNMHNSPKETDLLKQMIEDLNREIEINTEEKEELRMHMERLRVDYRALKQENQNLSSKLEGNRLEQMNMHNEYTDSLATIKEFKLKVERLDKEIVKRDLESSESLDTINQLETQVKSLENELEKRTQDFEDDLEAVTQAKVEQEQRAIRAEEDLRKTRWNNSNAAERLQEEFKRLSVEMASKFDENEKMAMRAVAEANDLRIQKIVLEEKLQKANEEVGLIKDQYKLEMQERWSKEREDRERVFASVRKEAEEKLLVESSALRNLKDEKEIIVGTLQSEIKSLKCQYDELKHCLRKIELEKEELRKQVFKLEGDLQEKEEAITSLTEKVKSVDSTEKVKSFEGKKGLNQGRIQNVNILVKEKDLKNQIELESSGENIGQPDMDSIQGMSKQKFAKVPVKSETETRPEKELKVSNCHINDDSNLKILLSEVSSLKQRNKHMEVELKEMQEKYSEVSLRFAEVEGERQHLVMTLRNLKNGKKK